jgi:hypothetical protein
MIKPADLTAFHQHCYSPSRQVNGVNKPIETVAEGAHYLRKTIEQ